MKKYRRWQRIVILFLLSLSVFSPLFLVSNKLHTLKSEGWKDFVQDLTTIKSRRELFPQYAVKQEVREGLKEPNPDVYRDRSYSIFSFSKDLYSKSEGLATHTSDNSEAYGSEQNGTNRGIENEVKLIQTREEPSPRRITDNSDRRVHALHVTKRGQDNRTHTQRITDQKKRQIKDHIIRARAYLGLTIPSTNNTHLLKELQLRLNELEQAMGESKRGSLSTSATQKMRNMKATLIKASQEFPNPFKMVTKLRAMTDNAEEQVSFHHNQINFLTELAGRTTPKGLHCLSMRLTTEYFVLPREEQLSLIQHNVYSPDLLNYVVFSDNILAAAVVVNSTVSNAKEPEKIAFHVVSDSLNFIAFLMWFQLNPPGKASIQVLNVEDFKRLLSNIFTSSLKKENSFDPRFASPLNHLRFYLPQMFPKLNKIVFFDHDIVVQRDLTDLWTVDMKGKVNGAVETCQEGESSYRRMNMLINLSDPLVDGMFDANACTWAFGMNLFDLRQWRKQDLTSTYQRFLQMSIERPLCKAGTLPLGWLTFYKHTIPLDRKWHLSGLGSDTRATSEEIEDAAVIHYDGVMKPWLDIGMRKYKAYWNKYINFDHPYLQQCNLNG